MTDNVSSTSHVVSTGDIRDEGTDIAIVVVSKLCDQIWRNFKSLWLFFEGLFSIGQNLYPNWANIYDNGQIYIFVNG